MWPIPHYRLQFLMLFLLSGISFTAVGDNTMFVKEEKCSFYTVFFVIHSAEVLWTVYLR